jgi:hypothetical protein
MLGACYYLNLHINNCIHSRHFCLPFWLLFHAIWLDTIFWKRGFVWVTLANFGSIWSSFTSYYEASLKSIDFIFFKTWLCKNDFKNINYINVKPQSNQPMVLFRKKDYVSFHPPPPKFIKRDFWMIFYFIYYQICLKLS